MPHWGWRQTSCGLGTRYESVSNCPAISPRRPREGGDPYTPFFVLSLVQRPSFTCEARGYGSPPSRGRLAGRSRMISLAALIRRDIRIALRVGGGALIGVLFFLTVVVLMPFA